MHKCLVNFVCACVCAVLLAACGGGTLNPTAREATTLARSHSYALDSSAAGRKVLYRFKGTPDGASPFSGFVAVNGTLYGTTLNGSSNYCSNSCAGNQCYLGCGTVFSVDSSGNEQVIYNFRGHFNSAQDGSWPFAGLTALRGALYGTTSSAGAYDHGTVYTVTTSGQESVLYSFLGGSDAAGPEASLTPLTNKLYGTTVLGGGSGCGGYGCGTVFSVATTGKEHVLYRFAGGEDGARVYAPVSVLGDELYGATLVGGGSGCGGNGCGTIFGLSLNGKERVIYRFTGGSDGAFPNGLIAVKGVLYGTTEAGAAKNSGTFFSITTSGALSTLHTFQDIPDGNGPGASLIFYKGNFYGTTIGGGVVGYGTVFKASTSGKETVLTSFKGGRGGVQPEGPVFAFNGELYGTTTDGGKSGCGGNGCGTIFKVKP